MGRVAAYALMATLWLALVAYGAQQLANGMGRAFNETADRIEGRGNDQN